MLAQRSATVRRRGRGSAWRLDREERLERRLDQYQQARSAGQDAARLDQLRQTLFTPKNSCAWKAPGARSPAQNR